MGSEAGARMARPGRRSAVEALGGRVRVVGYLVVVWVFAGAVGLVPRWISRTSPSMRWCFVVAPLALVGVAIGGQVMSHVARRRSVRQLRAMDFRLCLKCRYPLSGLDDAGACPECGERFDREGLVNGWQMTYPELWADPGTGPNVRGDTEATRVNAARR